MALTRNVPLRRTPMKRGTSRLARTRMKVYRPKPAVALSVRLQLIDRAGGRCEANLFGCLGAGTDVHHRITRKAGGRKGEAAAHHDRLSGLVLLCRLCHTWVTDNPGTAYTLGLCLKEHQFTDLEPVAYRGECWALLGDDGSAVGFP